MSYMPGTTLKDLDDTDSETLLDYYYWLCRTYGDNSGELPEESGQIVYRDGKPYRKVKPQDSIGLRSI